MKTDKRTELANTVSSVASSLKDLSTLLNERMKELERREAFDKWLKEEIRSIKRIS